MKIQRIQESIMSVGAGYKNLSQGLQFCLLSDHSDQFFCSLIKKICIKCIQDFQGVFFFYIKKDSLKFLNTLRCETT